MFINLFKNSSLSTFLFVSLKIEVALISIFDNSSSFKFKLIPTPTTTPLNSEPTKTDSAKIPEIFFPVPERRTAHHS